MARSVSLDRPGATHTVLVDGLWDGPVLTSHAETPSIAPNVTLLRAGERDLATAVLLPNGRDPDDDTPLPVLMDPYGGPHAQRVTASHNAYLSSQWFADQGFAVIVADGRGTPGRGAEWERAVRHDLANPPLDDQVDALHACAERFSFLDLDRVAIRGWSFGGYLAALAVLTRPDVFHAAIAGAPVTEWRLYDTHYTERYLGDPNIDDGAAVYDANSLLPIASQLERPLLLIHGLADDNVVAAHTLRLSSALLAAGRPHEVLPLVGVTHMTPQEVVAENILRHQLDFLSRALGPESGIIGIMTDRLAELYRGVAVHATADAEHRAALELLTLVMLADDHIDDVEVDVVREISEEWRGDDFAFEDQLRPAIESARRAIETDRTAEFLDDIDATISSRVLRAALFSAARDVAGANEALSPGEGTILAEVAVRFG